MALATSMRASRVSAVSRGNRHHQRQVAPAVAASRPAMVGMPVAPRSSAAALAGGARRLPVRAAGAAAAARPSAAGAVRVEANLLGRLLRVVRAYVSNFTEQFEDPEVMLDRVTDEMQEDLIKMRQATAKVMASERQMAAKYASAQATADEWLRRAELAVRKGQDELAREALLRRKTYDGAAASLKVQLDAQRRAMEQLQANVRMLESKMAEARNKRETLKARAASAKSSKQVQEMVAGLRLSSTTSWAAFDKMEEKVLSMEAEAESAALLATPDGLESKFAALEGSGAVEDELAALKRGLLPAARSAGAPAPALGRPVSEVLGATATAVKVSRAPAGDAIDAELEALRRRARG